VRFVYRLRDSAVLFNLFARRKKLVSPVAEATAVPVDPTDVVETMPAAAVVTLPPVEAVPASPSAPHLSEVDDAPAAIVEPTVVAVDDTVAEAPAEPEPTPVAEPVIVAEPETVVEPETVATTELGPQPEPSELPAEAPIAVPSGPAKVRPPTVPELRAEAKSLGLTGYSRLPKAELLRLIADHHAK
jgi:Rho termination factor, N-terminal domain